MNYTVNLRSGDNFNLNLENKYKDNSSASNVHQTGSKNVTDHQIDVNLVVKNDTRNDLDAGGFVHKINTTRIPGNLPDFGTDQGKNRHSLTTTLKEAVGMFTKKMNNLGHLIGEKVGNSPGGRALIKPEKVE